MWRIMELKRMNAMYDKAEAKTYTFEEILKEKGFLVYTNVGTSMMPLLRQRRDIIEIRPPKGRCKKYDAVLYKRGKKYILHRIIKVRPADYVIVGDNCISREYGITDDMVLGVMTRVIRNGKEILPDDFWYKVYVHLWVDFYHIRVIILYLHKLVYKFGHGIKKLISMCGREGSS